MYLFIIGFTQNNVSIMKVQNLSVFFAVTYSVLEVAWDMFCVYLWEEGRKEERKNN